MNSSDKILRFAPDIYEDENNVTMLAIYNAQSLELNNYENIISRVFLNNLVKYCNLEGIKRFEAIFYIQADEENDTLEFRKARVINKFNQLPPFTKIFVKQMLEIVFGSEKYEFDIYNDAYKVKVAIESDIEGLVSETFKDLRQIIPANMIIEQKVYFEYLHGYLKRHFTHAELSELTQGELSQYA